MSVRVLYFGGSGDKREFRKLPTYYNNIIVYVYCTVLYGIIRCIGKIWG